MKIPKAFHLFGIRHVVKIVPQSDWQHESECVGIYYEQACEIHLVERSQANMEQAFFHELLHAILTLLGYEKLSDDEQLIDTMASLIHQALGSAEFP